MKLFLQKKCRIFERWGLRPQTPVPPAAGALPQNPQSLAAWGLRPQTSIGFRRLRAPPPDPQNSLPHCEFLATRLNMTNACSFSDGILMPTNNLRILFAVVSHRE